MADDEYTALSSGVIVRDVDLEDRDGIFGFPAQAGVGKSPTNLAATPETAQVVFAGDSVITLDTRAENIPSRVTFVSEHPLTFAGEVCLRGSVVEINAERLRQSRDRDGRSFLTLSDAEQVERYGRVAFRVGDHSTAIAEADEHARIDAIQQAKFAADRDGLQTLKDAWEEERLATARAKLVWHSSNSGRRSDTG